MEILSSHPVHESRSRVKFRCKWRRNEWEFIPANDSDIYRKSRIVYREMWKIENETSQITNPTLPTY